MRDLDTHKWLPGIKSGFLGPKLGFADKDNGWMTMDNVRIPRNQMLQKFKKVDRDGTVSIVGDMRMMYSTMLSTRLYIIATCRETLAKALLIGLRYSVVRRQFRNVSGSKQET